MSDEDRDVDIESEDELEAEEKNSGSQFQTQVSRRNVTCFRPNAKSASGGFGRSNSFTRRKRKKHNTGAEKRAHHNALERKRRDHIKDSFTGLRDSIPSLHGEKVVKKASRAQILKKAADYIQIMRKKNHIHQQDIDDLKRQNHLLEQQIRSMEKSRNLGNYSTSNMLDNSPIINNRGNSISAFDGGSGTETSDSESSHQNRRKKLKTASPVTSSSET